jgi:uncharacterized protein (DUF2147 family)
MRTIYRLMLAVFVAALASPAMAVDLPNEFWINDKAGWTVETKPCDTGLCGYLVDFPSAHTVRPDGPEKDVHNPDKSKRAQPMCGMLLMGGFKPAKPEGKAWENGWVYDPVSGDTFSGTISVVDDHTVKLRGYLGISLFGKTMMLRRASDVPFQCSAPTTR